MALIDVVIPNYNYGRYLPECVDSIVRQGIDDIRILIVDNASKDDSVAVANRLAAADDRIVVVAREVNLGHHASFNYGVDWAQSKYFLLLCADDLLTPECFKNSLKILEHEPDVSFVSGAELVWHEEKPFPDFGQSDHPWRFLSMEEFALERSLPSKVLFGGGAALIRTADLKRVGHFRSDIVFNEDLEMFLRLALNRRVAITDTVHGIRRVHGSNISAIFWTDFTKDMIETKGAFESFFTRDAFMYPGTKKLRRQVNRNLGKRAYWSAMSHFARGHHQAGFALLKYSVDAAPRLAIVPPIDYLFRLGNPVDRIRSRLAEAMSGQGKA